MENQDIPAFSYQSRKARPAVDPAMKRMALGAAIVSAVVIGVALAWSGIRPGMGFGPPPEIHAPPGPLRTAPADPGGLTLPGSDEPIMSGAVSSAAPELAPAGPDPAIAALTQEANPAPAPLPAPATPDAAPAIAPAVAASAIALPPPLPPQPPAVAAAPATTAAPVASTIEVQLAATGDAASARRSWEALQARMPRLLGGRTPLITPADVAGETIWHLRLGGFSGRAAADAFCDTVIAQNGPCTVVGF